MTSNLQLALDNTINKGFDSKFSTTFERLKTLSSTNQLKHIIKGRVFIEIVYDFKLI